MMMIAQVPEAAQQMKKFEARVTKLRQTPGLDADPDVGQDDGGDCDDDDKQLDDDDLACGDVDDIFTMAADDVEDCRLTGQLVDELIFRFCMQR